MRLERSRSSASSCCSLCSVRLACSRSDSSMASSRNTFAEGGAQTVQEVGDCARAWGEALSGAGAAAAVVAQGRRVGREAGARGGGAARQGRARSRAPKLLAKDSLA